MKKFFALAAAALMMSGVAYAGDGMDAASSATVQVPIVLTCSNGDNLTFGAVTSGTVLLDQAGPTFHTSGDNTAGYHMVATAVPGSGATATGDPYTFNINGSAAPGAVMGDKEYFVLAFTAPPLFTGQTIGVDFTPHYRADFSGTKRGIYAGSIHFQAVYN